MKLLSLMSLCGALLLAGCAADEAPTVVPGTNGPVGGANGPPGGTEAAHPGATQAAPPGGGAAPEGVGVPSR